jgi:hypothetical protein
MSAQVLARRPDVRKECSCGAPDHPETWSLSFKARSGRTWTDIHLEFATEDQAWEFFRFIKQNGALSTFTEAAMR